MPDLTDEFAAALELVRRHAPATLTLRLSSDRARTVRLYLEKIEGISPSDLRPLDDGRTMKGT